MMFFRDFAIVVLWRLVTVPIAAVRGSAAPMPQPYPSAFTISFVTNITINDEDNISTIKNAPDYPLSGKLYYHYPYQRIDHAAGSVECVRFYHTTGPCTLLFLPHAGMYRLLYDNENQIHKNNSNHTTIHNLRHHRRQAFVPTDCCLDLPRVETPPPNWSALAHPTFDGIVHDVYSNQFAYQWTFDHLTPSMDPFLYYLSRNENNDNREITERALYHRHSNDTMVLPSKYHTLRQVVPSLNQQENNNTTVVLPPVVPWQPLVFTFPDGTGRQDFHYSYEDWTKGPPDNALFALPPGCAQRKCSDFD
jgi:hypothetical protein